MLIKAPLIKNGIEKLHEETCYFMSRISAAGGWSKGFFHTDFYDKVVKNNPALEKHFKKLFKEFKGLPASRKAEIVAEFTTHNSISDLCHNNQALTRYWSDSTYPKFAKSVKDLFEFMYDETLSKVSYKNFSGESLPDHYIAYRDECSSSMCPFCGLEDYIDLHPEFEGRDAYDHYLFKAGYPFAAINPANLFPMCHECNTRFKKAQDVLFREDKTTRRRAAYPPDDVFDISITIDNAFSPTPYATISLVDTSDTTKTEKFDTWLKIFSIRQRYEGRVIKKKGDWLKKVVANLNFAPLETDLPIKLETEYSEVRNSLTLGTQRESHLISSFLGYCLTHVDSLSDFIEQNKEFAQYLKKRAQILTTST
jgi:hypothetical protein